MLSASSLTAAGGSGGSGSVAEATGPMRYPIPLSRIVEYRDRLEHILAHPSDFPKYELAEAYERFAICLFFYGNYSEAEIMLVQTMKVRKELPTTVSNCRCLLLLGNIAFKTGDLPQAEAQFSILIDASKKAKNKSYEAIGQSNLAVAKYEQGKLYEGIDAAKVAIDISAKVNAKESEAHCQHIRIFLVGILKNQDFRKFETVLDDYPLPPVERALILSTCKFIQGKFNDAKQVLNNSLKNDVEESLETYTAPAPAPEINDNDLQLECSVKSSYAADEDSSKSNDLKLPLIAAPKVPPKVGAATEGMLMSCAQTKYNMRILLSKIPVDDKALRGDVDNVDGMKSIIDIIASYIETYKSFQIDEIKNRNPFIIGKLDQNPLLESVDHVMSPLVLLSQLLISQGESIVKAFNPRKSAVISRSVVVGLDGDDYSCKSVHLETLERLRSFFSPNKIREFRLNEIGAKFLGDDGKLIPSLDKLETPEVLTESTIAALRMYDWNATQDMMFISGAFWSFLEGNREDVNSFSGTSNNLLKTRHNVIISAKTGIKDKSSSIMPAAPSFAEKDKDSKEKRREKKDEKLPRKAAIVAPNYSSNNLDNFTSRAAILPFASPFGTTDVNLLLSWVLGATGCPGLGFMTSASKKTIPFDPNMIPNPNVKESESKRPVVYKGADPEPTEELLREARGRLIEVENEFDERYKSSDSYLPGDKELRFILNVCLARISIQLNIRPNLQTYIATIEALATDLVKDKQYCEPNVMALARRCKLDFDEWLNAGSTASNDKKLNKMCTELIPMIKEYIYYAKLGGDIELQRDSLRRYMNMYIEISKVPNNPGDPPLVHATLDKLESLFLQKDIEKKEKSDCNWMRQYGRARAQQILKQYKELN